MYDMSGLAYFLLAGMGAIVGLLVCVVFLLPISLLWPPIWSAAFWVIGGFTFAGLIYGFVVER